MKSSRRPVDIAQRLLPFQQAVTMPAHATYCVYTHSIRGAVFSIGMGRPERPFQRTGRTQRWREFVARSAAYDVAIVFWTDDARLARAEEARMIRQYQPVCNVLHHPDPPPNPRDVATPAHYARLDSLCCPSLQPIFDTIRTLAFRGATLDVCPGRQTRQRSPGPLGQPHRLAPRR